MPQITVIICTYNRKLYLEKALLSVTSQSIPKDNYEVIVVDNASTDGTKELVEAFSNYNVTYLFEEKIGLSHARNKGFMHAESAIVAYLDDDATACHSWLEKIIEGFSFSHRVAAVGGKISLNWEAESPSWISGPMLGELGFLDFGSQVHVIQKHEWLAGGNLAFMKSALIELGGFNTNLGRSGKSLMTNEETEVLYQLQEKNYDCVYHPGAEIFHAVPEYRTKPKYFRERFFAKGISNAIVDIRRRNLNQTQRYILACKLIIRFLTSPSKIASLIASPFTTRLIKIEIISRSNIGYLVSLLRFKP